MSIDYLQKLKPVEQVPQLLFSVGECFAESVVCETEVLQHAEVEEHVVELLEVVVTEVQLV